MNRLQSLREPRDERGFTIIELMIVVAIIAILAIVVVPMFTGESKKVIVKLLLRPPSMNQHFRRGSPVDE